MLLSMTGFGAATHQSDDVLFTVEVRSVNNRYLKIVSKLPDTCGALEGQVERAVRERVRRGTVSVFARINTPPGVATTLTDERLMAEYATQFREIAERLELSGDVTLETLLAVAGVLKPEMYGPSISIGHARQKVRDEPKSWRRCRAPCLSQGPGGSGR